MSQLRKSASFRSRIPVRRSRFPQRRCCSPPPGGVRLRGSSGECGRSNGRILQTNRSFAFEASRIGNNGNDINNQLANVVNSNSSNNIQHKRYSSSSSFSSSDESYESEAPHKKFIKQNHKIPDEHSMYISTDAISLDGLLDSVSSGSFSSPPSPVQYQNTKMPLSHSSSYESLDKYNMALESFNLSDNVHHIPYSLAPSNYYNLDGKPSSNVATKIDSIRDDFKKPYYAEKQKQLSDWYYLKQSSNNPMEKPHPSPAMEENIRTENKQQTHQQQQNDSSSIEHHRHGDNGPNMVHTATGYSQDEPSKSFASSSTPLATVTDTDSTGRAFSSAQTMKIVNWNNFDCQDTPETNDTGTNDDVIRKPDNDPPITDNIHPSVKEKAERWLAWRQFNDDSAANRDEDFIHQYDNVNSQSSDDLAPCRLIHEGNSDGKICHQPDCDCSRNQCGNQISAATQNAASTSGATGVSVNLLKQHYQQQHIQRKGDYRANYPLQIGDNNYVNSGFKQRVTRGNCLRPNGYKNPASKSNCFNNAAKNNVELQLEHWENISNMHRTTACNTKLVVIDAGTGGAVQVSRAIQTASYQNNNAPNNGINGRGNNVSNINNSNKIPATVTNIAQGGHQQPYQQNLSVSESTQQQLQQTIPEEKQRPSKCGGTASMYPHPQMHRYHHHNYHHHHHQQQQQQVEQDQQTQLRQPCTPMEANSCSEPFGNILQLTQNQIRTKHQHHQQKHQLQQQQPPASNVRSGTNHNIIIPNTSNSAMTPILSTRLTVVATPRAAVRSRLIQKRSDETSCSSSFEQLNVIGAQTAIASTSRTISPQPLYKQYPYDYQTLQYQEPYDARHQLHSHQSPHQRRHQASKGQEIYEENDEQISTTTITQTGLADNPKTDDIVPKNCPSSNILPNSTPTNSIISGEDPTQSNPETKRRPLPEIPLEDAPSKIFPPKTSSCRSDCELSGSYASLECPSPPGPPVCLPESRRDPQARLSTYLRTFYTDLSLKEPIIPQWAIPVAPGALCPARLEPELRLHAQSHGFNDTLTIDQILISLQTKEGTFLEAPRRVLIECPTWTSRSNLCLRILHSWAKEPPWPAKGTPVALALFIPLSEAKRSLSHYVEKDLLPKGPLNPFASGFGGFTAAWNSLEALGPKLLIVIDGYENQKSGTPKRKGKQYMNDVHDLLDGRLFPEARLIITTSSTNYTELLPIIQRHITFEGLTWGRSASLLGGGQWGGPSRLLDTVQGCVNLRKAVRTPLGCLAIAATYEATGGDLPTEELDVVESILNCVAPEASANNVAELGRLALFCLKMKRTCISMAEIRMYCSCPDANIMGCLDKSLLLGKTAKKKGEYVYNPICPGMMEFLAANYIASLVNRPGLLAAEITGLSIGDELDMDLLKVIKFAMGLLGDRAHILLSRLTPLWLTPQIVFSLALAGGNAEENLAALCDILGISKHPPISPLESKPLWVQVRSVPTDLMGWGMALKSSTCTLKNLELIYQLEKHNLHDARNAIEIFLDSISINESVSTLRVSSLIETEVKDCEITYLANCVSKLLLKPRLENFELVLTLLEEDPPILKLQSVVAALCRAIPRQPKLSFLLLDLGLSTSQLVQLCTTLEKCPNVTRLSLPHLRCERGAISALSSLLSVRPISFLSLPSCWGARDDPPSSSGVSMGSGSGSSTGTSGLIKQGSLPGVPSPRSYAPGIFSSLPRGVFVPPTTLGRSATLPRQPLEQTIDKRSCDSVVSKNWYPTPACDGGPHNSGTLHDLLLAARESYSKLHGLDLSKAQLSLEDSMCLGETVRLSNTLHTLKLEGSSRLSEILPSVLGASESPCLQMLSIGSPRLSLEDSAIAMCARALTSCSTLRLLSLDGWSFRIENTSTLSIARAFLSLTSIRELSLANCRLQIGLIRSDTKVSKAFESRSVVVLKLAGAQVAVSDGNILRGPQLLPYIGGFPCLRELDLSAPARSGLGSTHSSPLILDDKCIISFFQHLHTHFGLLNTLKICNWVIHFDEVSRTLKTLSKCIRNSPISHLKVDGISVLDRPRKHRIESHFIHCFISSLPLIRWMGISLSGKKEDQVTAIGNAVLDLKGYEIDIKLSESTIEHAKLMAQAISLDGKFDIKVSTFGTSSGILIHAEKSGTKSLTRKNKD